MKSQKIQFRRRKWKRFKVKGGTSVILSKPSLVKLGKPTKYEFGTVVDISMGGLAAQYLDNKKRPDNFPALTVSPASKEIQLESAPFNVISDVIVAELTDKKVIRNCCLCFGPLSHEQKFQLEALIKKNTVSIIDDRRSEIDRRKFIDIRFNKPDYGLKHDKRRGIDRRVIVA